MSVAAASRTRTGRARRTILAALLLTIAALLISAEAETRAGEAMLARAVIAPFTPGRAVASGSIVYFGIGTPEVTGLSITTLCSTTVLVVPLVLLAVAVLGVTRARSSRVGLGLALGVIVAVTSNMIRFGSAAWAYSEYGREGFDLVHRYLGSLFVIAGFIAAILLSLRIALRESSRRPIPDAAPRRRGRTRTVEAPRRTRRDDSPVASRESDTASPAEPPGPAAPLRRDRHRTGTRPGRKDRR
ncbi:hypothetical protein NS220_07700 [Microbacterium testaceum]|uniref:Exosortase/archaeosortase family protein n=1 Tax=Microbacterium testaceum TaxID=2033 RepID=A0A147EXS1_MICTE|nr:exosortase S [Microbacterium testaceum]KTR94889.1 hypothetical protein NS220_07700 [Microbacterium testaceum]